MLLWAVMATGAPAGGAAGVDGTWCAVFACSKAVRTFLPMEYDERLVMIFKCMWRGVLG